MATIIENAAKGQRAAMTTLYEANKQKVYFVAKCLLMDSEQAANATITVFREIWSNLKSADIATEARFSNYLICRTIDYCKSKVYKKNPKALRIPFNKNFAIPANLIVDDSYECEVGYLLAHLPETQKYIFVMHTAGCMEVMQIARILKFDSKTVRTAIETEADNVKRLQGMSKKGYNSSYEEILEDIKQTEADTVVPVQIDEQITAVIDGIATPIEAKERKKKYTLSVFSVLIIACLLIGALILGLSSGNSDDSVVDDTTSSDTSNATGTFTDSDTTGGTEGSTNTTDATDGNEDASAVLDESLIYYADIAIEDYGTITVQLDQSAAPITVANFVELAQSGFYDGLTFHRIIEGFMMQGGCPEGTGYGGSDEEIVGEFSENGYDNPLSHTRGAISMARSNDYDSASSQFFIVHEDAIESLDGKYAAFGYVTEGMDVVDAVCEAAEPTDGNGSIAAEDQPVITSVTIRTESKE